MSKVVLTSTPFHGHVAPFLATAADLTRRGHEVLFYTGSRFEKQIAETGARFVPYPADVDYDDRDLEATFPRRAGLSPLDRLAFDLKYVFSDPTPVHERRLQEILAAFPATTVIGEPSSFGMLPIALRAPRSERPLILSLGILPPTFESADTAPFGPGLPPPSTEQERAQYAAMKPAVREALADAQHHLEKIFESMGVSLPDFFRNSMVTVPDQWLQLTIPSFEYPRSDAPSGFRFIGALPADNVGSYQLPEWWGTLGNRPVVVVTQGTLENHDLTQLILPTIQALADLDVTVVAATARPDGPDALRAELGKVPNNVHLTGYVPFERLLPLSSLLITNAGYGGVQTALRHGVPLVVAGDTEDKPEVAARVAWSGVGVNLLTGRPDVPAIRKAVEKVLGNAAFKSRALDLQAEYLRHEPLETIAEIVERQA
ncbi:glycosyltransferase [Streptomyces sp. NPDC087843]|uniref:glycosyltransferase n=1 Tax=Streptomyces sp. NPDC087843 TaxID=3365804 RepID=UPI0037F491A4